MDRAAHYECEGLRFESSWARHLERRNFMIMFGLMVFYVIVLVALILPHFKVRLLTEPLYAYMCAGLTLFFQYTLVARSAASGPVTFEVIFILKVMTAFIVLNAWRNAWASRLILKEKTCKHPIWYAKEWYSFTTWVFICVFMLYMLYVNC